MDEWLAECRFAYSLSVPAKYGEQYTLTEIWDPFVSTIRKMEKELGCNIGQATQLLNVLRDLPRIRNMLAAHENDFAKEFPRSVIADVGSKTIALIESMYCAKCCSFAVAIPNRHQPKMMHCRCEAIRYVKP
jgi:hypothetical protein